MNQTSIIFAVLFAAWLVFITARGELPSYIGVLTGSVPAPKQTQTTSDSGSSIIQDAATVAQFAAIAGG